jgi:Lipid A 3-O-deacylase (PagL)
VLGLASLLCALYAFPQSPASPSEPSEPSERSDEETLSLVRQEQSFVVEHFNISQYLAYSVTASAPATRDRQFFALAPDASSPAGDGPGASSKVEPAEVSPKPAKPPDFNRDIYYRNRLEFTLEGGWLPINIPFPLDIFVGDNYNTYPLQYTLVPIIASLRWHLCGVSGPIVLRGNWDLSFSGSITAIPRGPESRYFAYIMGIRRNFVPRRSRVAPFFDIRLGVGNIDAKGPEGVPYAQGEDLTFTVQMGSGIRYNFSPRYALTGGLNFMHISNLDLSEGNGKPSWGIRNYGINVYGPMVGFEVQLRRHAHSSE